MKRQWPEDYILGQYRKRWGGGSVIIKCQEWPVCGKVYKIYASRLKQGRGRFCSKDCKNKYHATFMRGIDLGGSRILECKQCGGKFKCYKSELNRECCSRKCKNKRHRLKAGGEKHPNWKGGNRPRWRGTGWRETRLSALARDKYTCQDCNLSSRSVRLIVHHVTPYRSFKDWKDANQLNNLVTLCRACHAKRERRVSFVSRRCSPDPALNKGDYFNCLICGSQFWRKPNEIKKGHNKFCSRACANRRGIAPKECRAVL